MSEWGNLTNGRLVITKVRGTRGIEISQYPEEKKVKTILSVATSERGGAQIKHKTRNTEVESDWETEPKSVKAA